VPNQIISPCGVHSHLDRTWSACGRAARAPALRVCHMYMSMYMYMCMYMYMLHSHVHVHVHVMCMSCVHVACGMWHVACGLWHVHMCMCMRMCTTRASSRRKVESTSCPKSLDPDMFLSCFNKTPDLRPVCTTTYTRRDPPRRYTILVP
jgi:hypothetical protein